MTNSVEDQVQYLLETVIKVESADRGNVQIFDQEKETLTIIAQKGFLPDFIEHFKIVNAFGTFACGRALGIKSTVSITDVNKDIAFKSHRGIAEKAGFRSVKSIPVITNDKRCVGIISVHFKLPMIIVPPNRLDKILPDLAILLDRKDS